MVQIDIFKPVRIFGYCFILMGMIGLLMHFSLLKNINYTIEFVYFVLIISAFHFLTGIGVILRKNWGFHVFKFYLHSLYLALPVGTYIAVKTLKYIERHKIKRFFK